MTKIVASKINFIILENVHCTLYNVQCTMYNVQCTLYIIQIYNVMKISEIVLFCNPIKTAFKQIVNYVNNKMAN